MPQKHFPTFSWFPTLTLIALLLVGYINIPANAQSRPYDVFKKLGADQDVQAKKVIDGSVLKIKDMLFPKVAPPLTEEAYQGCCEPYQTRTITGVAGINLSTPKGWPKKKFKPADGPEEKVYSPPLNCWVISSYSINVKSAKDPYEASDDAQPGNFQYVTTSEYQAVSEQMKDYVGSLNILDKYKADFKLKLEEFLKNYGHYSNAISTSHGQVRHKGRVQGAGWFNGTSAYKADVTTTEVCCPPEVRDAGALQRTLKAWVDQTAAKLPRSYPLYDVVPKGDWRVTP